MLKNEIDVESVVVSVEFDRAAEASSASCTAATRLHEAVERTLAVCGLDAPAQDASAPGRRSCDGDHAVAVDWAMSLSKEKTALPILGERAGVAALGLLLSRLSSLAKHSLAYLPRYPDDADHAHENKTLARRASVRLARRREASRGGRSRGPLTPKRRRRLEARPGESLLNDGTAIVVFEVFYDALEENACNPAMPEVGTVFVALLRLGFVGPVLGCVCGWVAATWLGSMLNDPFSEIVITIMACYGSYSLGDGVCGTSGVLTVVFCGMWISRFGKGRISAKSEHAVHSFWGVFGHVANTVIFFMTGLIVAVNVIIAEDGTGEGAPVAEELVAGAVRYLARKLEVPEEADVETDGHTVRNIDFWYLIALYLALHVVRAIVVLVSLPVLNRGAYGMTGVFLGMMNSDANEILPPVQHLSPFDLTGNGYSAAAARLSYVFALKGPAQTADTACSPKLVAAHAARASLRSGESADAVVLGPNLHLHPGVSMVGGAIAGMNSLLGKCHTLDARADGYLRAEGCGGAVFTLAGSGRRGADDDDVDTKPLLVAPGKQCVVGGMALRHNGRAASFTALNGVAQRDLIEAAIVDAGVAPGAVGFLEMHGTGTALGDPVECAAPSELYAKGRAPGRGLALAGVKANFGHTESSAGIAGLLKALVLLADGDQGKNAQLRKINPKVKGVIADGTRCSVEPAPLPPGHVAGVSSFGFSGIIGHAVLFTEDSDEGSLNGVRPERVGKKVDDEDVALDQVFHSDVGVALYRKKTKFRYDTAPDHRLCSREAAQMAAAATHFDKSVIARRLGAQSSSPWTVEVTVAPDVIAIMADHKVRGQSLFPSTLTLACAINPVDGSIEIYSYTTDKKERQSSSTAVVATASGCVLSDDRGAVFLSNVAKAGTRPPLALLTQRSVAASSKIAQQVAATDAAVKSAHVSTTTTTTTTKAKPGDVVEEYTLIPASIDGVALDVTGSSFLGGRSGPDGRDERPTATCWSHSVQEYVAPKEERCTVSMLLPGASASNYSVETLRVKAAGPPKTSHGLLHDDDGGGAAPDFYLGIVKDVTMPGPFWENRLPCIRAKDLDSLVDAAAVFTSARSKTRADDGKLRPSTVTRLGDTALLSLRAVAGRYDVVDVEPVEQHVHKVLQQRPRIALTKNAAVVVLGSPALGLLAATSSCIPSDRYLVVATGGVSSRIPARRVAALRRRQESGNCVFTTEAPRSAQELLALAAVARRIAGTNQLVILDDDDSGVDISPLLAEGAEIVRILLKPATLASFESGSALLGCAEEVSTGIATSTVFATPPRWTTASTIERRLLGGGSATATYLDSGLELLRDALGGGGLPTGTSLVAPRLDYVDVSASTKKSPKKHGARVALPAPTRGAAPSAPQAAAAPTTTGPSTADVLATITKIAGSLIGALPEASAPLMAGEGGFDSLTSTDFVNKLGIEFDIEMPSSLLFDYPTLTAVAGFISQGLAKKATAAAPVAAAPPPPQQAPQPTRRRVQARPVAAAAPRPTTTVVAAAPPRDKSALVATITNIVKSLVGAEPSPTEPLMTASGFDSLVTNDFTKKLSIEYDTEMPSTLLFDNPTIDAVAEYLDKTLAPPVAAATTAVSAQPTAATAPAPLGPVVDEAFDEFEGSYEYLGDSDVAPWSAEELAKSQCLVGQVAVLAGASRGIGRAIAIALAKRGCHCAIFGQSTVKEVASECERVGAPGTRAMGIKVDIRDRAKVAEAVDKVRAEFGDRIDILVQSASVHRGGDLREIDERGFDFVQKTNVLGTSNIMHVCLPYLRLSSRPQFLAVAPAPISAKSYLRFSRGSIIYASAKLMMGFYLELWKRSFPGIAMYALWPKYVVLSPATQGNNDSLAADEKKMVKPIYIGESAALALTQPPPENRSKGRAEYYLDADIHMAMQTGRAHRDFVIQDSRPWHELEVCFLIEVEDRSDIIQAYDVPVSAEIVAEPEADRRLFIKTLVVGAFNFVLGDPADVAILLYDDGSDLAFEDDGYRRFVAKTSADCGEALDEALAYLGGTADVVLFACDTCLGRKTAHGGPDVEVDLPSTYERLVKFPFFVFKELKLRREALLAERGSLPKLVAVSAPPDVFPLTNANITLNEVLTFRSLIFAGIAIEFEAEGSPPNPEVRMFWTDDQSPVDTFDEKVRGRLPKTVAGIAELHRHVLVSVVVSQAQDTVPTASFSVFRLVDADGAKERDLFRPTLAPYLVSKCAAWLEWHERAEPTPDDAWDVDAQRPLELVCVAKCEQSVTKPPGRLGSSSGGGATSGGTLPLPPSGRASGTSSTSASATPPAREAIAVLRRSTEDDGAPVARELEVVAPGTEGSAARTRTTPKCLGVCLWRDSPNTNALLALFDDGSLRAYDAVRPPRQPQKLQDATTRDEATLASDREQDHFVGEGTGRALDEDMRDDEDDDEDDDDDDENDDVDEDDDRGVEDDLSSSLVSGTNGTLGAYVPLADGELPHPPCTIFESLHLLPAHRVTLEKELQAPSEEGRRSRARASQNEDYVVGSRSEGGTVLVRVPQPERLAALRILLGSGSSDTVPALLIAGGHRFPTTRERRWYDFILTDDDRKRAQSLGAVVVSLVDPNRATSTVAPMIDVIEAYTDVPLETPTSKKAGKVAAEENPAAQSDAAEPRKTTDGFRAAGFVTMTALERSKVAAPTLQRAVVAAARARVALKDLEGTKDDDDDQVVAGTTTAAQRTFTQRQGKGPPSATAVNEECFFDLDAPPSKDGHGVVQIAASELVREAPDEKQGDEAAAAKRKVVAVAVQLVKLTCLAKDRVRWPGLRAAASTLCDVAADFKRSKAKALADGARLQFLEEAIGDDAILRRAPASVALLAFSLAKTRAAPFAQMTRSRCGDSFVFARLLTHLADSRPTTSPRSDKKRAIQVVVELAARELDFKCSDEDQDDDDAEGACFTDGFALLQTVLENDDDDVADAATATLANALAKDAATRTARKASQEETLPLVDESAAKGDHSMALDDTADSKEDAKEAMDCDDDDDDDEKKDEVEQRESKPEPMDVDLQGGASPIPPASTTDATSSSRKTLSSRLLPLLILRVIGLTSNIDVSKSDMVRWTRSLARYVAVLLVVAADADDDATALITGALAARLSSLVGVGALSVRSVDGVQARPGRHAHRLSVRDGVQWHGDTNNADAVRADVVVFFLEALRRLCSSGPRTSTALGGKVNDGKPTTKRKPLPTVAEEPLPQTLQVADAKMDADDDELTTASQKKKAAFHSVPAVSPDPTTAASVAFAAVLRDTHVLTHDKVQGLRLRDAIVAQCRRAAVNASLSAEDDDVDDGDNTGQDDLDEDHDKDDREIGVHDDEMEFRRALLLGSGDPTLPRSMPSSAAASNRILLKKDLVEAARVGLIIDAASKVESKEQERQQETLPSESQDAADDDDHVAVVAVLQATEQREEEQRRSQQRAPLTTPVSRDWWAGYLLRPSSATPTAAGLDDDDDDADDDDDRREARSPTDARAALAFFTAAVDACAAIRGNLVRWPPALAVALCVAAAKHQLPKAVRRSAKRALKRVCGGSTLEYRAARDTHAFAAKADLLHDASCSAELDHAKTVALEAALLDVLAVARQRPYNWRTFCARPLLGRIFSDDNDDDGGDDDLQADHVQVELRKTSTSRSDTASALLQLCWKLPSESTALRVTLELVELCTRSPASATSSKKPPPPPSDELREDARAEAESATREGLEDSAGLSRTGSEIAEVLTCASQRRRFCRFLGLGPPASLVKFEGATTSRKSPVSRAALALVSRLAAKDTAAQMAYGLSSFAETIVLDGATTSIRELGAAFLCHVYRVFPAEARKAVFEKLAEVAPRETRRSAGGRGAELLSTLASAVVSSSSTVTWPEANSVVKTLARDLCNALVACASALDARRDALSIYAVTDNLGLPRYFDCDDDGDDNDDPLVGDPLGRAVSHAGAAASGTFSSAARFRRRGSRVVGATSSEWVDHAALRTAGCDRDASDLPLPYYDSTDLPDESSGTFLFDDGTSSRRQAAPTPFPRRRAGSLESMSAASATTADLAGRTFNFDAAFSDGEDNAAQDEAPWHRPAPSKQESSSSSGLSLRQRVGATLQSALKQSQSSTLALPPSSSGPVASSSGSQSATQAAAARQAMRSVALEDLRKGARCTESCAIAQLRGVRRIHEIELRVREARCRQPKRVRVYYSAHQVENTTALAVPAHWHVWSIAAELTLRRGRSTVIKHVFTTPLVAANLLFEYVDFYDLATPSSSASSTTGQGSSSRRRRAGDEGDDSDFVGRFFAGPFSGQAPRSSSSGGGSRGQTSVLAPAAARGSTVAATGPADYIFSAARRFAAHPRRKGDARADSSSPTPGARGGGRSGTLHCPRCGRRVSDAHGVCQHCGQVAFQCRSCRHLNYERLDAFLCVECGYCAFGEFSCVLKSEAAPDALPITTKAELEAARARLADYADAARDARAALSRLLPEASSLARQCASVSDAPPALFFVGRLPRASRSVFFDQEPRLALSAAPSTARAKLLRASAEQPTAMTRTTTTKRATFADEATHDAQAGSGGADAGTGQSPALDRIAEKRRNEAKDKAVDGKKFLARLDDAVRRGSEFVRAAGARNVAPPNDSWGAVDAASCALVAATDVRSFATPGFCAELAADTGALVAAALPSRQTLAALYDRDDVDDAGSSTEDARRSFDKRDGSGRFPTSVHVGGGGVLPDIDGILWDLSRSAAEARHASVRRLLQGGRPFFARADGGELGSAPASLAGLAALRATTLGGARQSRRSRAATRIALRAGDEDDLFLPPPPPQVSEDGGERQRMRRASIWSSSGGGGGASRPSESSFAAAFSAARRRAVEAGGAIALGRSSRRSTNPSPSRSGSGENDEDDDAPFGGGSRRSRRPPGSRRLDETSAALLLSAAPGAGTSMEAQLVAEDILFETGGNPRRVFASAARSTSTGRQQRAAPAPASSSPAAPGSSTMPPPPRQVDEVADSDDETDQALLEDLEAASAVRAAERRRRGGRRDVDYDSAISRLLRDRAGSSDEDDDDDDDREEDADVEDVALPDDDQNGGGSGGGRDEDDEDDDGRDEDDEDDDEHPVVLDDAMDEDDDGEDNDDEEDEDEGVVLAASSERGRQRLSSEEDAFDSWELLDLPAVRRQRQLEEAQQQLRQQKRKAALVPAPSAKPTSVHKRFALEQLVISMHERRWLTSIGALRHGHNDGNSTSTTTKALSSAQQQQHRASSNAGSAQQVSSVDPRCRELLDLYRNACGPLHADLRRATKRATETAARIRSYHQIFGRQPLRVAKKRRHEEDDEEEELAQPQECSRATAVAIARLADLGRVLAKRCEDADAALATRGFAEALIFAMATTLHCEPRAFRAASLALRALCAKSPTALAETHAAIRGDDAALSETHQSERRREDRRRALHVALRDVLCAPPSSSRKEDPSWALHVVLAASRVRDTARAARDSAVFADAVLRPCLAVVCRLVGLHHSRGGVHQGDGDELAPAEQRLSLVPVNAARWVQAELCDVTTRGYATSRWLAPREASAMLLVSRCFKGWRRVTRSRTIAGPETTTPPPPPPAMKNHSKPWLLDAVLNVHSAAVRHKAALLLVATAPPPQQVVANPSYAGLEAVCATMAATQPAVSAKLLAAVADLLLGGDAATLENLRGCGFGRFCRRLARAEGDQLLRRDAQYLATPSASAAAAAPAVLAAALVSADENAAEFRKVLIRGAGTTSAATGSEVLRGPPEASLMPCQLPGSAQEAAESRDGAVDGDGWTLVKKGPSPVPRSTHETETVAQPSRYAILPLDEVDVVEARDAAAERFGGPGQAPRRRLKRKTRRPRRRRAAQSTATHVVVDWGASQSLPDEFKKAADALNVPEGLGVVTENVDDDSDDELEDLSADAVVVTENDDADSDDEFEKGVPTPIRWSARRCLARRVFSDLAKADVRRESTAPLPPEAAVPDDDDDDDWSDDASGTARGDVRAAKRRRKKRRRRQRGRERRDLAKENEAALPESLSQKSRKKLRRRARVAAAAAAAFDRLDASRLALRAAQSKGEVAAVQASLGRVDAKAFHADVRAEIARRLAVLKQHAKELLAALPSSSAKRRRAPKTRIPGLALRVGEDGADCLYRALLTSPTREAVDDLKADLAAFLEAKPDVRSGGRSLRELVAREQRARRRAGTHGCAGVGTMATFAAMASATVVVCRRQGRGDFVVKCVVGEDRAKVHYVHLKDGHFRRLEAAEVVDVRCLDTTDLSNEDLVLLGGAVAVDDAIWTTKATAEGGLVVQVAQALLRQGATLVGDVVAYLVRYERGSELGAFQGTVQYTHGAAVDLAELLEGVAVGDQGEVTLGKATVRVGHVLTEPDVFFDVDALSVRRAEGGVAVIELLPNNALDLVAVVARARRRECEAVVAEEGVDHDAFCEAWAERRKAGFAAILPPAWSSRATRRRLFKTVFADVVPEKGATHKVATYAKCVVEYGAVHGVPTPALDEKAKLKRTKVIPTSVRAALPTGTHPYVHTKSLKDFLRNYNFAISVSDVTVQLVLAWINMDDGPGAESFDFSQSGYLWLRELALGNESLSVGKDATAERRAKVEAMWGLFLEEHAGVYKAFVKPAAEYVAAAKRARLEMERHKKKYEQRCRDAEKSVVRTFQDFGAEDDMAHVIATANAVNSRTREWATCFKNFYMSPETKKDYERCCERTIKGTVVSVAALDENAYVIHGTIESKRQLAALVKKLIDDVAKRGAKFLDESDMRNIGDHFEEAFLTTVFRDGNGERDAEGEGHGDVDGASLELSTETKRTIARRLRGIFDVCWKAVGGVLQPDKPSPPSKKSRGGNARTADLAQRKMRAQTERAENRAADGKRPASGDKVSTFSFCYYRRQAKGKCTAVGSEAPVLDFKLTTMLRELDKLTYSARSDVFDQWNEERTWRAERAERARQKRAESVVVKDEDAMDESDDHGGDDGAVEEQNDDGEFLWTEDVEDEEEEEGRFAGLDVDLENPTTVQVHALWLRTRPRDPFRRPPVYLAPPADDVHGLHIDAHDVERVLKLGPMKMEGPSKRKTKDMDRLVFDVVTPCLFSTAPQLKRLRRLRHDTKKGKEWGGWNPLWSELLVNGRIDGLCLPTGLVLRGDMLFVQCDDVKSASRGRSASGGCEYLSCKGFDSLDKHRLRSRDQQKDNALNDVKNIQHGRGVYRVEDARARTVTEDVESMHEWTALGAIDWGKDPTASFARVRDVEATLHDTNNHWKPGTLTQAIRAASQARVTMLENICINHAHSTADATPSQRSVFEDFDQTGELNKDATAYSVKLLGPWARNVLAHETNRCFEDWYRLSNPEFDRAQKAMAAVSTLRPRTTEEFLKYVDARCAAAPALRERHFCAEGRRAAFARFRANQRGYQQIADVIIGRKVFLPDEVQGRVDTWAKERVAAVVKNEPALFRSNKERELDAARKKEQEQFETNRAQRRHQPDKVQKVVPARACVWERLHTMRRAGVAVEVAQNIKYEALPLEHRRRVGRLQTQARRDHHQSCLDKATVLMSFAGDRTPGHTLVSKKKVMRCMARHINVGVGDEYKTSCVCQGCFGRCKYSRDRQLKDHAVGYNNTFGVEIPYTSDGGSTCPLCRQGVVIGRDYPETFGMQQIFVARRRGWRTPYDRETTDHFCGTAKR